MLILNSRGNRDGPDPRKELSPASGWEQSGGKFDFGKGVCPSERGPKYASATEERVKEGLGETMQTRNGGKWTFLRGGHVVSKN